MLRPPAGCSPTKEWLPLPPRSKCRTWGGRGQSRRGAAGPSGGEPSRARVLASAGSAAAWQPAWTPPGRRPLTRCSAARLAEPARPEASSCCPGSDTCGSKEVGWAPSYNSSRNEGGGACPDSDTCGCGEVRPAVDPMRASLRERGCFIAYRVHCLYGVAVYHSQ
jgi:hypothetical protein